MHRLRRLHRRLRQRDGQDELAARPDPLRHRERPRASAGRAPQMFERVFRPRVLVYGARAAARSRRPSSPAWRCAAPSRSTWCATAASLARRSRAAASRTSTALQLMNATEAPQRFRVGVEGCRAPWSRPRADVDVAPTEARWVPVAVQVPPQQAQRARARARTPCGSTSRAYADAGPRGRRCRRSRPSSSLAERNTMNDRIEQPPARRAGACRGGASASSGSTFGARCGGRRRDARSGIIAVHGARPAWCRNTAARRAPGRRGVADARAGSRAPADSPQPRGVDTPLNRRDRRRPKGAAPCTNAR